MNIRRMTIVLTAALFIGGNAWGVGGGGAGGGGMGAGGAVGGGGGMGGGSMGGSAGPGGVGAGGSGSVNAPGGGGGIEKGMQGAGEGAKGTLGGAEKGGAAAAHGLKDTAGSVRDGTSKLFGKELGKYRGESGKARFHRFTKSLKLTREQREKVMPHFNDEAKELKELYAKNLGRGEREEAERGILGRYYEKVKDVLTPDQLKKYVKLRGGE